MIIFSAFITYKNIYGDYFILLKDRQKINTKQIVYGINLSNQKSSDKNQNQSEINIINSQCFSTREIMNTNNQLLQSNDKGLEDAEAKYQSFQDFNLKYNLIRGIYNFGYEKPSTIQKIGTPAILTQKDCIIQGQSGTGKTATFLISALQLLQQSPHVQCLILTPTRQLANQIYNVALGLNEYLKLGIKAFVGGTDTRDDRKALQNGQVNIGIGTPGRVKQMIDRQWLKTAHIKLVILDEADEMIKGFEQAMRDIFAELSSDTQMCLISATMPKEVLQIADMFMKQPIKILLQKKEVTVKGIKQFFIAMRDQTQKLGTLIQLYKNLQIGQCILFLNTKERAIELAQQLRKLKFPIIVLTGDMPDQERRSVMRKFRSGQSRVLLSTDLIGRGIDIQQVNLVINYDMPYSLEKYIHRIGRTGRLGRKGVAINFITQGDANTMAQIEKEYGSKMQELPLDLAHIYE